MSALHFAFMSLIVKSELLDWYEKKCEPTVTLDTTLHLVKFALPD